MLEFKYLGEAEIIQILKQLIETANIAHCRDVQIFMRKYLSALIEDPRVIYGLFLSLEARRFRSARPIIWTILKEFGVHIPIEKRTFHACS